MTYNAGEEIDLTLALQLQAQFEEEFRVELNSKNKNKCYTNKRKRSEITEDECQEKLSVSLVDPSWEVLDPNPDLHLLFQIFDRQFFWRQLEGVEVKWSPRMTLCAGICRYERRGGLCSIGISVPLLKLRPRKDLIETLIHEMIHAYLFVTHNNKDHDAHGPEFHKHMYRINKLAGTNITVYHSFHDEVAVYRQHIWQCNGPCRIRPPYYGLVKRSMNRPPSPRDLWWNTHMQSCGGTYTKIKEPDGYSNKRKGNCRNKTLSDKTSDIRKYFNTQKINTPALTSSELKDQSKANKPLSNNSLIIKGASNANVHGFSGHNDKNLKSSNTSKGNNATDSTKTNHKINRTGQCLSTATGSKTITVKGNKNSASTPKNNSANLGFIAFRGQGHSLNTDSAFSHVEIKNRFLDRLCNNAESQVDANDSNTKNKNSGDNNPDNSSIIINSSEDEEEIEQDTQVLCPMCNNEMDRNGFDKHVAECIGELKDCAFEYDELSSCKSSESQHDDSVVVIEDDDNDEAEKRQIPCPVCDEKVNCDKIDIHVNSHFD